MYSNHLFKIQIDSHYNLKTYKVCVRNYGVLIGHILHASLTHLYWVTTWSQHSKNVIQDQVQHMSDLILVPACLEFHKSTATQV